LFCGLVEPFLGYTFALRMAARAGEVLLPHHYDTGDPETRENLVELGHETIQIVHDATADLGPQVGRLQLRLGAKHHGVVGTPLVTFSRSDTLGR
jgi:hypothetical protein